MDLLRLFVPVWVHLDAKSVFCSFVLDVDSRKCHWGSFIHGCLKELCDLIVQMWGVYFSFFFLCVMRMLIDTLEYSL